jgi:hypothetical protein
MIILNRDEANKREKMKTRMLSRPRKQKSLFTAAPLRLCTLLLVGGCYSSWMVEPSLDTETTREENPSAADNNRRETDSLTIDTTTASLIDTDSVVDSCAPRIDGLPDTEREAVDASVCAPMFDFYWVVPSKLAGMSLPGKSQAIESDLCYLEEVRITLLFTLTEESLLLNPCDWTFAVVHVPVADFTAPAIEQLLFFLALTEEEISRGGSVAVHCLGGTGRSGTFLSAYFIYQGMSVEEAVAHVRESRPGAVETASQMDVLNELYLLLYEN